VLLILLAKFVSEVSRSLVGRLTRDMNVFFAPWEIAAAVPFALQEFRTSSTHSLYYTRANMYTYIHTYNNAISIQ
jgi:hypothetical protein